VLAADEPRLVLIDLLGQTLRVLSAGHEVFRCRVSTAKNGIGCREGSGCTPWGWHRIASIVGLDQPIGARFVSREPSGEIWGGGAVDGDWILTRLLWLEGLEPGVNRGPGVDSYERYIYIHGTNQEDLLGVPASHGCVRVSNADAMLLAGHLREGDPVFLHPRGDTQ
jgi:UDP-N-acetylmuramate--alanine ligase